VGGEVAAEAGWWTRRNTDDKLMAQLRGCRKARRTSLSWWIQSFHTLASSGLVQLREAADSV